MPDGLVGAVPRVALLRKNVMDQLVKGGVRVAVKVMFSPTVGVVVFTAKVNVYVGEGEGEGEAVGVGVGVGEASIGVTVTLLLAR